MLHSTSFYNWDVYFAYFHTTQGAWDRNFAKGEYILKLKHWNLELKRILRPVRTTKTQVYKKNK